MAEILVSMNMEDSTENITFKENPGESKRRNNWDIWEKQRASTKALRLKTCYSI